MILHFKKMQALGNDFIVINNLDKSVALTPMMMTRLADRHRGIGFDQLLMLEPSSRENCHFHYRIFNSDGSEVGQCGNGARCIAKFIRDEKLSMANEITLSTQTTVITVKYNSDHSISVDMGFPSFEPAMIPLNVEQAALTYSLSIHQESLHFCAVNIGNPHAVIICDDINQIAIEEIGKTLNNHVWFPEGVNVGFMQIIDRENIQLRVYERGVGETLACGSGACAAAIAGIQQNLLAAEVNIYLTGGKLTVSWQGEQSPVWMTGGAHHVFDGKMSSDFN